jgi:hypothetical protein
MKCYILIAGLLGTLALASPIADPVADPVADAVADPNDYGYGYGYGHKTCEEISCKPVKCHGTEWVCIRLNRVLLVSCLLIITRICASAKTTGSMNARRAVRTGSLIIRYFSF